MNTQTTKPAVTISFNNATKKHDCFVDGQILSSSVYVDYLQYHAKRKDLPKRIAKLATEKGINFETDIVYVGASLVAYEEIAKKATAAAAAKAAKADADAKAKAAKAAAATTAAVKPADPSHVAMPSTMGVTLADVAAAVPVPTEVVEAIAPKNGKKDGKPRSQPKKTVKA